MNIKEYIILAVGSITVGVILTFIVLGVSARARIDLNEQLWVLAIPAVLSLTLNIILLEIYRKIKGRK